MKPTPELVLNHAFAKIAMEMGPALPPGYGQGSATTTGVLMLLVGQEFNRAAALRHRENEDMRSLFAEHCASCSEPLAAQLRAAADTKDSSLLVSDLDAANGKLKTLLIALQAHAENSANKPLEQRILTLLRGWSAARLVHLPAM